MEIVVLKLCVNVQQFLTINPSVITTWRARFYTIYLYIKIQYFLEKQVLFFCIFHLMSLFPFPHSEVIYSEITNQGINETRMDNCARNRRKEYFINEKIEKNYNNNNNCMFFCLFFIFIVNLINTLMNIEIVNYYHEYLLSFVEFLLDSQ